jgi:predicted kinase
VTAYGEELNRRTYAELGRRASTELGRRGGVIVDATFRCRQDRAAFAVAVGGGSDPVFVQCHAPAVVLAARADARRGQMGQASDAGAPMALQQQRDFNALDEIPPDRQVVLRTDRPLPAVIDELEAFLDEHPSRH